MKKMLLFAVIAALLLSCAVPSGISAAETVTEFSERLVQPSEEKLKFKQEYEIACSEVGEGLIVVRKNGLCGYADLDGNIVIPPQFENAEPFKNGVAVVNNYAGDDGHPSLIGRDGSKIADLDCTVAKPCGSMLSISTYNWDNIPSVLAFGLAAPDGTVVVPPQYDSLFPLTDTLFRVQSADSLWGVIDASGKVILPPEYESVSYNETVGLLHAEKSFPDPDATPAVPPEDDSLAFAQDWLDTWENTKAGFLDLDGNPVIPLEYDTVVFGEEGPAIAVKDGKYGGLDRNGNTVIPFEYEWLGCQSEGLFAYMENGLCGYMDENRVTVIPPKYENARVFSEDGLARVTKDGLWGFINREGNEVIPCEWPESVAFSHGLAFAGDGTKTVCFGTSGEVLFELPPVQIVETSENGLTVYYQIHTDADGQRIWEYGLVDRAGNEILPLAYHDITLWQNGWISMSTKEFPDFSEGLVSPDGQLVFEPTYFYSPHFSDGYCVLQGRVMWYIIDEEGNLVL